MLSFNAVKKQQLFHSYIQLLFFILFIIGVVIRIYFMPIISADYENFLKKWLIIINEHGFFAFRDNFADYNYIYMYCLLLISKFDFDELYAIKFFSIVFDFAMMLATYAILKINSSSVASMVGALAVFLCPTCVINSSGWAQCDSIYVFFLLSSLYYILKRNGIYATICFSMAFCFKLQSIFILPMYAIIFLNKKLRKYYKVSIWYIFFPPIFSIIMALPTLLVGNKLDNVFLLKTYFLQINSYKEFLSLNAPTLFSFFDHNTCLYNILINYAPFISISVIMMIVTMFAIYYRHYKCNFVAHILLITQFLSSLSIYILPKMHDRYFFFCDIMSIIVMLYYRQLILVPASICIISASLISYNIYFPFMPQIFSIKHAAVIMFCGIVFTGIALRVLSK